MSEPDPPRCPVCRARFRGTRECARCGADLGPLMTLLVLAHRERRRARDAILAGMLESARAHLFAAQELCSSKTGRRLALVLAVLSGDGSSPERGVPAAPSPG